MPPLLFKYGEREKEVRRHAAESARPQASTVAPAAVLNASLGAGLLLLVLLLWLGLLLLAPLGS